MSPLTHTHEPSEWAAALPLGLIPLGALILVLAFADADLDPRPAVRRSAGAVHQGAVYAGHDLNRAYALVLHEVQAAWTQAALTLAALLILTIPNGSTR